MVQKEVAERIIAKPGTKDYGVLSVMIEFYGDAVVNRTVSRKMFFPQPNVDSAVVTINLADKYSQIDNDKFYKFIQNVFAMRRKTLRNNLSHAGYSKEKILALGEEILSRRAENFALGELVAIFEKIT